MELLWNTKPQDSITKLQHAVVMLWIGQLVVFQQSGTTSCTSSLLLSCQRYAIMLVLSPNYSLLLEGLFHLLWLMLKMVEDVAASGFLGCGYQILRYIFNPIASFYRYSSLSSLYCRLEKKQRKYEQRICEVEIGCFAPLVFLTFGGVHYLQHFLPQYLTLRRM